MTHRIYILLLLFSAFKITAQETTTTEEVQDTFKTPQYEVVYDDVFLSKKETKWLVKVDFLPYIENRGGDSPNRIEGSIEFERKLGKVLSINTGLNWNYRSNYLPVSLSIEPRFYLNQKKGVQNLNGIYASCSMDYGVNFSSINKAETPAVHPENHLGLGIGVGLQKRIANNWYFNYQLGFVGTRNINKEFPLYENKVNNSFFINNKITFGFAIGGGKKSKIESCEVFRCFEEERNLFKIDIRGLFRSITKNGFASIFTLANETKLGKSAWSINNEFRAKIQRYKSDDKRGNQEDYNTNLFTFIVEPRFYFNLKKRIAQGKSANNLSGFYVGSATGVQLSSTVSNSLSESSQSFRKSENNRFALVSSVKLGLQKKVFKNGFFDISLTPVDFYFRNKKERNIIKEGSINLNTEEVFNEPFRFDFAVSEILPFIDFKIGFAF